MDFSTYPPRIRGAILRPGCASCCGVLLSALEGIDRLRLRNDRLRVSIPDEPGRRGALLAHVLTESIINGSRCGCLRLRVKGCQRCCSLQVFVGDAPSVVARENHMRAGNPLGVKPEIVGPREVKCQLRVLDRRPADDDTRTTRRTQLEHPPFTHACHGARREAPAALHLVDRRLDVLEVLASGTFGLPSQGIDNLQRAADGAFSVGDMRKAATELLVFGKKAGGAFLCGLALILRERVKR